ncbi:MAG: glycosyltransferase [Lachnospiraceae bacterium]|nr:glycosyltransferase [Lachnospiraceae bacterium]
MKKEQLLVTIITPCFNSEKTIEKTLKSVLNQTYHNIEYIIVDGASKDRTMDIVKSYGKKFEGRMKWVSEQDEGIYYAMNKGIAMASGELVGIVNSDDFYEPDAVEKMVEARSNVAYQILYGFERTLVDGKEASIVIHNHECLDRQMITHPTCFVTKKLYEDLGTFNTDYRYSSDYEFMLRMFHSGKVEFTPVYALISNFALGGASGTVKGYRETNRLKYEYHLISKARYRFVDIKCAINIFLRR